MEQTWYLFPGQKLETTKIKDRGKALIATPSAWKKITDHLDKKRVQQELLEEELEHKRYLKEGSYAMTKDWDNSVEKIRQRRLEEHEIKVRNREENLVKRFMELRAEQAEERNKFVEEAKKRIFMIKQDSRTLNSALVLTEVLHERRLQQQFDAMLLEKERVAAEKYAKLVDYNAEQEKRENAEKKRNRKETDVKYSEELMAQIKENEEKTTKKTEEIKLAEIEDNKRAVEEKKAIDEYEFLLDRRKKADVKQQFHDFAKEKKRIIEEAQKEDEIKDKIINIYAKGKCRIDAMKKKKEKEMQDKLIEVREKISAKVMANSGLQAEEEAILMANQQKEYEEKAQEVLKKKEAYQKRLRDERLEYRKQVLKTKEKEAADKKELDKWDMINRLKANEVMEKYEHDKAQRLFDEKIKYREELNNQMQEDDTSAYDQYCKEQDLLFEKQKLENEDRGYFAYADEVLGVAKARGRTTEHIEKVIHKYKVENGLEPKKKNISHLKSKVPINNKNK